ncbi:MAG: hypothetical protein QNK04_02110 [Myxococcota bacterium]|nr:hypothetical protein [Myxococcota bacterium]
MSRKSIRTLVVAASAALAAAGTAWALSEERWTDATPYGIFFNDYDPNFYTGFVPRVQEKQRIKIHLARGNQLRVRMVLPDATIDNFLTDQVAKHDLYQEVIDKEIITLTSNTAWEDYHQRFEAEGLREKAGRKKSLSPEQWRALNAETIEKLNPERLYRIQKSWGALADAWAGLLAKSEPAEALEGKLDLVNELFPHRMFVYDLTEEENAALGELITLAKSGDTASFRSKAEAFFQSVTGGIYEIRDGKIDYYEYTAIYPAGTYDTTTRYKGKQIPQITTQGIWYFKPRLHGTGMVGMVDYISGAGYYGLIPMFPYEYGGGSAYNSIHNTGISNWIQGHPLLPKEWKNHTEGSRSGKPYNRVALTSRGPVSHGCTRLNSGHLAELRELLPSTSPQMEGIVNYRNVSHCYDVFDRKGDGNVEIMGVQYYIAFRHTNQRVAKQIWSQNNRDDFYAWLYGDEMNYGPIGQVTFDDVCEGKFVKRKAVEGKHHKGLTLYEAPYQPETLQFYKIKGVDRLSHPGMDFNRELRRVGQGYQIDRKKLFLD